MRAVALLALLVATTTWGACQNAGEICKPGVACCAGLVCTARAGQASICVDAGPATTTTSTMVVSQTTTTRPATTSTTLAPRQTQAPIRPTGADVGQALLAGKGQFYVWYRGELTDQPVRDAMQQYVTGVVLPELSRVLEPVIPQVIAKFYKGEGGSLDVIYRRLGNIYENLASVWSIGPQGRNYSNDVDALGDIRDALVGKPEVPGMHVGLRDSLTLHLDESKRYARWDPDKPSFFVYPQPKAVESVGKRAPVNVRLSFPPKGSSAGLLVAANNAHAAASGIGMFPLGVDEAARAYEADSKSRDELHFRQMKRFTGYCDPRWGSDGCLKWKGIQHMFFACWTAAEAVGDWRTARNCDSNHQLVHILTNYYNLELDVRLSVPGMDEHDWPIENGPAVLKRLAP